MDSVNTVAAYVEKGGVGKTTSAAHHAVAADHYHDRDVLLIDLAGTQNDLATQFGLTTDVQEVDAPISAVFGSDWEFIRDNIPDIVDRMVFPTGEGPDLIPSDPGLGGADNNLADEPVEERFTKLHDFIHAEIAPRYDLVVLDLPGKEDNIALNGLFAAENVVAPLRPGAFERDQLHKLEDVLREINDEHGTAISLQLVYATLVDGRKNLHTDFVDDLADEYPEVAGTPVPDSANVGDEQATGQTLFALDEDELYSSGVRAREAYRANTDTLLNHIQ